MISLIAIILTISIIIISVLYLVSQKMRKKKNSGTVFFLLYCLLTFIVAISTSLIMVNANRNAIGSGELAAYVDNTPIYYDSDKNEYFTLSSEMWDLNKLSYRITIDKKDAEKMIQSYELHKESNSLLDKYR